MLKPAGKALEWLIRRFRINEYNVDAVMQAILPYHETALFVTMVSILQIEYVPFNLLLWQKQEHSIGTLSTNGIVFFNIIGRRVAGLFSAPFARASSLWTGLC